MGGESSRYHEAISRPDPLWTAYFADVPGKILLKIGVRYKVHPNWLTLASLGIGIGAAVLAAFGNLWWFLLAYQVSYIFDSQDGKLAHILELKSNIGAALDLSTDRIKFAFVAVGLFVGGVFEQNLLNSIFLATAFAYLCYGINSLILEKFGSRPIVEFGQRKRKWLRRSPLLSLVEIEMSIICIAPLLAFLGHGGFAGILLVLCIALMTFGLLVKWKRFVEDQ